MKYFVSTWLLGALVLCGCGEDEGAERVSQRGLHGNGGSETSTPSEAVPTEGPAGDVTGDQGQVVEYVPLEYAESTFVASEIENRDPFRGFARAFAVRVPTRLQRRVILAEVSIEEMRLIAIVSGNEQPRAMLVAPDGVGHVIKRGDYIGRPEIIQSNSVDAVPVTLNWRVDRIRPQEVVLTREDPTDRNRPPLTRVLPLHDEEDMLQAQFQITG